MLFNSIDFAVFLPLAFLLYWFVFHRSLRKQNLYLMVISYVFYGWWDWRFLSLIVLSTTVDYLVGLRISSCDETGRRKLLLALSMLTNLGILGFFKYFDFFLSNFRSAFTWMGAELSISSLEIVLPVGISFYTFQTMSYTIDVYRRKIDATNDPVAFAAFVSFFPQLVAGPIERASNLLPQFSSTRIFDRTAAVDGMRQILWGLFKKVVVADNCAVVANAVFNSSDDHSGSTLWLGAIMFAFQIYGDFSGYSDIAIGTSRLFGFNLMKNFSFPYFSRDIAEFWRRWHISLSTWFRDYLYIPLGGSRGGKLSAIRNIFIIFIVSGFWHGANWTFIIWGALNAVYFLPLFILSRNRVNLDVAGGSGSLPSLREGAGMLVTFGMTTVAWVFFRAQDLNHAISYTGSMFSAGVLEPMTGPVRSNARIPIVAVVTLLLIEWLGRRDEHGLQKFATQWPRPLRWAVYYGLALAVLLFIGKEEEFIYFQF